MKTDKQCSVDHVHDSSADQNDFKVPSTVLEPTASDVMLRGGAFVLRGGAFRVVIGQMHAQEPLLNTHRMVSVQTSPKKLGTPN